jgi:hypothetical protein
MQHLGVQRHVATKLVAADGSVHVVLNFKHHAGFHKRTIMLVATMLQMVMHFGDQDYCCREFHCCFTRSDKQC